VTPATFLYAEAGGVGTITLNRPDRLNALTFEVYRELTDFFAHLQERETARVIVITGAGRGFCSGGDVRDIIEPLFARDAAARREFTGMTCDLIRNMRRLRKPVIASLNGVVAGAGAVIAAAADFRIACEEARIAFLFTKVGLSGADMGAAWLLPRLVGLGRASELLYLGDFISAAQAEAWGLYHAVVPAAELAARTSELARRLADGPGYALGVTKRMLDLEAETGLEAALDMEAQAQAECMEHPDYREAFQAGREKRAPRYAGHSGPKP
jgi:enoyl-CoA hydratase/carnithine racemase